MHTILVGSEHFHPLITIIILILFKTILKFNHNVDQISHTHTYGTEFISFFPFCFPLIRDGTVLYRIGVIAAKRVCMPAQNLAKKINEHTQCIHAHHML